MNILLTVAYDGTNFFGWQKQEGKKTVQKDLEDAISSLFKKPVNIRGGSRTDRGVHANGQIALLKEQTNIPIQKLPLAINSFIKNNEIVVKDAIFVPKDFHPQNSVYKKTYIYKIFNARFLNPIFRNYCCFEKDELDIFKMQKASKYFLGEFDFKAFCASGTNAKTTVRTIFDIQVLKQDDDILCIKVCGSGFLYNMVRIIAGTLMDVGKNKILPCDIKKIIEDKDRTKAGKTAPANGLVLDKIYFN